jgi:hypothetical protein
LSQTAREPSQNRPNALIPTGSVAFSFEHCVTPDDRVVPPVPPAPGLPTIHLHFKVLWEPIVPRNAMVASMVQTFAAVGINVAEPSVEDLRVPLLVDLVDLDVGACTTDGPITNEEDRLFGYRNGAGTDDICVYFVRTMLPPVYSGCGTRARKLPGFPNGRPSVIIGATATRWTLGHECGHVLGLPHVPPQDRLMNERTSRIDALPPVLTAAEGTTMKTSRFLH